MSSPAKSTVLTALLGVILLYLATDLGTFHGPVRRWLEVAARGQRHIVARVYNQELTRSQLDRAVCERLWSEGKSIESLTTGERHAAFEAALDDLIDDALLRAKAGAQKPEITVSQQEINERLSVIATRFESPDEMSRAMESQSLGSERDLRERLTSRIRQEKSIESHIGPLIQTTDAEARRWFDENRGSLRIPDRVEVRHIFIPTLELPSATAKAKLVAALAELTSKAKDFATLAKELSEDPASNKAGGSLGWMTRARLPEDFAAAVFTLPLHQASLVRTRIGWHLVEVTGRLAAEPKRFDQAKPEIIAALDAVKRRHAIAAFRTSLRSSESPHIVRLPQNP